MGYLAAISTTMRGDGRVDLAALAVLTGRSLKSLQRLAERGRIQHVGKEPTWPYRKLYALQDIKHVLGETHMIEPVPAELQARNKALREQVDRQHKTLESIYSQALVGVARCNAAGRRDLGRLFTAIGLQVERVIDIYHEDVTGTG